ncbi:MAG: ADP-ribosylglycohydrolase family protein, partial [Candidatus Sumerlaeota bacterium]
LNGAIRADFYGYLHPGDPRGAARMAYNDAAVNMSKNGIYAALFVVGCISAAMSKNPTVETILQGGLSVVPKRSRLYEAVEWTRKEYEQAGEWEPVCDRIYERYGHLNWAGVMYNYPIVALSLLHGDMDFTKTIGTATMCGVDTDCNAGTVGSIVGAALGVGGIDPRWIDPFNDRIMTFVANNGGGDGTISDLVARTIALAFRQENYS